MARKTKVPRDQDHRNRARAITKWKGWAEEKTVVIAIQMASACLPLCTRRMISSALSAPLNMLQHRGCRLRP